MNLVIDLLRGVGGLLKYALRVFGLTLLAVNLVFGVMLVSIAFWIAADGSLVRGVLAGSLAAILVLILGFIAAFQVTSVLAISRAIEQAAIGRRVFDAVFDIALGVSDEDPGGRFDGTQAVHGMSVADVKARLTSAGDELLRRDEPVSGISGIVRWLATWLQRALVWATVKVIVRSCASGGPNPTVDLLELRSKLAGIVDREIADYLKQHATRILVSVAGIVIALSGLAALLIRQLPL